MGGAGAWQGSGHVTPFVQAAVSNFSTAYPRHDCPNIPEFEKRYDGTLHPGHLWFRPKCADQRGVLISEVSLYQR